LVRRISATDVFEFENGKISIIGFTVDNESPLIGITFENFYQEVSQQHLKFIAVLRNDENFIPKSDTIIRVKDHIYLSTDISDFNKINTYIGKTLRKIRRIMIIGDSPIAIDTAKLLEQKYDVSIVIKKREKCKEVSRYLQKSMVLHGDPNNSDLLLEEHLENMDAFIALTNNSEINILTSLIAVKHGVYKTIALVDNTAYTHISQNIGVDTLINQKLLAANDIFRFVRRGKVEAIASLHGVSAEVIEFFIHKDSVLTRKPIAGLNLPNSAVIVGVIRKNKGIIPTDDFIFEIGDKAIVFAMPNALTKIQEIFE
jgi:trk system potassium uptake protein TrkA